MNEMFFINLRISGIGLNLAEITKSLGKKPTFSCIKGEKIKSKYKSIKTEHTEDCWMYCKESNKKLSFQDNVNIFLDKFIDHSSYLKKLSQSFEVTIWIELYPEKEQFNLHLTPEILEKLHMFGTAADIQVAYLKAFYDGTYLNEDA